MALEHLRSRFLYKPLDAVMTAVARPERSRRDCLRELVSWRSPHYDRVSSFMALVDSVLPGSTRRASDYLCRPDGLPFEATGLKLLDRGSGSTVFRFDPGGRRMVLKAYRRSIGKRPARLVELAKWYRNKYETVSRWYAGCPGLVAPASFVVLEGPLLGRPAVACLQPFVDGEKRDLLGSLDDPELPCLIASSKELRDVFRVFVERTVELFRAGGAFVDLLGEKNLLLVDAGAGPALRLIDYGIFDLGALKAESPAIYERIGRLTSRLGSLLDEVLRHSRGVIG